MTQFQSVAWCRWPTFMSPSVVIVDLAEMAVSVPGGPHPGCVEGQTLESRISATSGIKERGGLLTSAKCKSSRNPSSAASLTNWGTTQNCKMSCCVMLFALPETQLSQQSEKRPQMPRVPA